MLQVEIFVNKILSQVSIVSRLPVVLILHLHQMVFSFCYRHFYVTSLFCNNKFLILVTGSFVDQFFHYKFRVISLECFIMYMKTRGLLVTLLNEQQQQQQTSQSTTRLIYMYMYKLINYHIGSHNYQMPRWWCSEFERLPHKRKVWCSNTSGDKAKSLKQVVTAPLLNVRHKSILRQKFSPLNTLLTKDNCNTFLSNQYESRLKSKMDWASGLALNILLVHC